MWFLLVLVFKNLNGLEWPASRSTGCVVAIDGGQEACEAGQMQSMRRLWLTNQAETNDAIEPPEDAFHLEDGCNTMNSGGWIKGFTWLLKRTMG